MAANGAIKSSLDIGGYRERGAAAVGLEVGELTSAESNGWQEVEGATRRAQAAETALLRRIVAYALLRRDELPFGDIAQILDETVSWARYSIDYVERHVERSYAFRRKVDQVMEAYGPGAPIGRVRKRIAGVVGLRVEELVAIENGSDTEMMQRVAVWLLLSKDGLPIGQVAGVMGKDEQWVRSAKDYVERRVKRDDGLKAYVEKTTAAHALAISDGMVDQKSLEARGR
jgi:hypothetical protein